MGQAWMEMAVLKHRNYSAGGVGTVARRYCWFVGLLLVVVAVLLLQLLQNHVVVVPVDPGAIVPIPVVAVIAVAAGAWPGGWGPWQLQ